jgi:hypothetical protein
MKSTKPSSGLKDESLVDQALPEPQAKTTSTRACAYDRQGVHTGVLVVLLVVIAVSGAATVVSLVVAAPQLRELWQLGAEDLQGRADDDEVEGERSREVRPEAAEHELRQPTVER